MDPQQLTMMAHKFQAVVDADVLNDRGSQRAFAKRQRQLTPCRFGLSVIASMATKQIPSIAALHRDFNALWDVESTYKACYNQGAQTSCAAFFRTSLGDLMGKWTMKVLGFEAGQALSACKRCVMQDGRALALHDALAHLFPGRFHAVKPAAVALHCPMDVLHDAPIPIALSPDTDAEHADLPDPARLRGEVFLADRGCLDLASWRELARHGGFLLVRGKAGLHPRVLNAFRADGARIKSCQERDCHAIISPCPTRQRAALEVEWRMDHEPFRLRLIVRWNPQTKSCDDL